MIEFDVPGELGRKNRLYGLARGRPFLTDRARGFKERVARAAREAARAADWPDPYSVAWCRLSLRARNTDCDADASISLVQDALEGVLYENDRVVGWREVNPDPIVWDGGGPGVAVQAELVAVHPPEVVAWARAEAARRRENRVRRDLGLRPLAPLPRPGGPGLGLA